MNSPHYPGNFLPGTIVANIMRVRLESGDVFDLSCFCIVDVLSVPDCCGSPPVCVVRMESGRDHRVDHDPFYLKVLFTDWQRSTAAK